MPIDLPNQCSVGRAHVGERGRCDADGEKRLRVTWVIDGHNSEAGLQIMRAKGHFQSCSGVYQPMENLRCINYRLELAEVMANGSNSGFLTVERKTKEVAISHFWTVATYSPTGQVHLTSG